MTVSAGHNPQGIAGAPPFDRLAQGMVAGFALLKPITDATGLPSDFLVLSINAAFAAQTGLSPADIAGQPLSQLLPESQFSWFPHLFSAATAEHATPHFQFHDQRLNRHFCATAFRVDNHHIVLTCLEIPQQGSTEVGMRAAAIEILTGGIAHDFNKLLAHIESHVAEGLANLHTEDTVAAAHLETARADTRTARKLVRQLAALIRKGSPLKETVAAGRIIRETTHFCTRGSAIHCTFHLPDSLWPAKIDAISLSQAIQGIVARATQAMPNGGTITLHAENITLPPDTDLPIMPGHHIRIAFSDSGPAIAADELPRIFTPPQPGEHIPDRPALSASFSIARDHGGHITATSRPGAGTRIEMYLPAHPKSSATHNLSNPEPSSIAKQSGRILIMDDDASMRQLLTHSLTRLGYETDQAANGDDAIALYRHAMDSGKPFSAVILDLVIPEGMDGKATLDELTKLNPDVKAVVCSGLISSPCLTHYREHGFTAALPKPFSLRTLATTMSQLLASQAAPAGPPHTQP